MRNIPKPSFDHDTARLVRYYKRAVQTIKNEIESRDISRASHANSRAMLKEVSDVILELDKNAEEWVKENIPKSAREGVARSLVTLGLAEDLDEARTIVKFNKLNRALVEAAVSDTYQDLAQVTQNIDRKTKAGIRRIFSEVMREQYTQGVTGTDTIKRETLNRMYKELDSLVNTGFIDAVGRVWRAETYVDMLAREKMNQTYFEANINEAVSREAFYGVISSHGAIDACRYHEGRIVKLVDDAPGDYPTIDELKATNQIFHVNCRHHVSTLRDPDRLPDSVLEKAERQAELGEKAISVGGRNPDVS